MLKAIVADALGRSDLLILTGGLGPTDDDLTRDVVADLIGRPLEYHADIFEAIEKRFAARGLRTPEINRRQAMVPQGAAVLPNKNGTAPGLWIEHEQKLIVLLPGPPRELKPMFEAVIQERLLGHVGALAAVSAAAAHYRPERIVRRREDAAALREMARGADENHDDHSRVARSDRAASDGDCLECRRGASRARRSGGDVPATLGRDLFSTNGETMQQVVGELLRSRGLQIAAAESCTGGLVMARLTEVPGSSDYVDRGVVVYSNQSKTDLLGVPPLLIAAHGAVSEPVAEAMASGMVRSAGADLAVGVTGVAGPTGGTPEKPVGMVAIAAAWARNGTIETRVRTFNFVGGREMVRFQASQAALDMVRRWLIE